MKKRKKSGDAEGAAGSNDGRCIQNASRASPHSEFVRERSVVDALKQAHTCPITHALFVDPVVAADGNTYERSFCVLFCSSDNAFTGRQSRNG